MQKEVQESFNTQPPEGGWNIKAGVVVGSYLFQHTAARRRLVLVVSVIFISHLVSTHSRPKAAGLTVLTVNCISAWFQHTAARRRLAEDFVPTLAEKPVSTHSRPKAAGSKRIRKISISMVSTHSRPKAAGVSGIMNKEHLQCFNTQPPEGGWKRPLFVNGIPELFQHTAARRRLGKNAHSLSTVFSFQHTAARRRLVSAV